MATRQDILAIKERIDMVSLISRYVSLVKSGSGFKGRCPFHKDDTPSFVVSPDKGLWHCFGCGEGGDVVAFLMKIERLTFVEAAQRLAEEAGVAFSTQEDGEREAMRGIMAAAAEHFASNLANTREGKKARAYFESRGFGEEAWKRFGLGYAFPGWDHVKRAFGGRFGIDKLVQLGLLVEGDKGTYDRFRDRTIFPIYDLSGRPIAFGGRAFEGEPKYLNSPTTPLFDKGRHLYGLSWAREAAREQKAAILVEGYTDVLTLHQAGIENVVGSMGTALTQGQADLLGRFVEEVVIAYDRDAAGGAASMRGMQILRNSGLAVRVVRLPEDEDPDSLVRKAGADAMRQFVADAVPFHRFYLDALAEANDSATVTGKERILSEARDFYRGIRSLPLRQEVAQAISDLLDLPFEGVSRELGARSRRATPGDGVVGEEATPRFGEEEILLSLLLRGDIGWDRVAAAATPDDFSPPLRPIAEAVANAGESPIISELLEGLDTESARRARELSLIENAFDDDTDRAVQDALDRLVRLPALERKLELLDREIRASSQAADWGRWEELTREQHALKLEKRSLVSEKIARRGLHGREQRKARSEED